MHDLTQGSIPRHIVRMAAPLAIGMVFQMAYYLVDLYFVARLGDAAIAGVSAAGNLQFFVMALTQVLGVGTMVLIAAIAALVVLVGGYLLGDTYLGALAADEETARNGRAYLFAFLPALAIQFALISMGSALRGTGIAKPTMLVQMFTVVLNIVLAPVLIAGWLTGRPLGVAGAGLASSIAVAGGVIVLLIYFVRLEKFVGFDAALFRPQFAVWGRLLRIGVPAGGEFALMFLSMGVIYWIIRDFGAAAQAGFGVGSRVLQALFLPAMAIAFAAVPIAGQNVAAGKPLRARETFIESIKIGTVLMASLTLVAQWRPEWFVHWFSDDSAVIAVAAQFLAVISWNFVASGIVFTCSGMFQAMGNTVPSVISSAVRLVLFVAPAIWISRRPGFELHHLWYVSVAATTAHALFTLWLLRREVAKRRELGLAPATVPAAA